MKTTNHTTHRILEEENGKRGYRIATRQEATGRAILKRWSSASVEVETQEAAMLFAMLKVLRDAVKDGTGNYNITARITFEEMSDDDVKRLEALRGVATGWDVRITKPHVDAVYYGHAPVSEEQRHESPVK